MGREAFIYSITLAVSALPTPELCPENSPEVPLWPPWLLVLLGTICFAPGLLWHPFIKCSLHSWWWWVLLRAEQLWAHFGLSGSWTRSGHNGSSSHGDGGEGPLEISDAFTEHQPASREGPFCRRHRPDGYFALELPALVGDRLIRAASLVRWFWYLLNSVSGVCSGHRFC